MQTQSNHRRRPLCACVLCAIDQSELALAVLTSAIETAERLGSQRLILLSVATPETLSTSDGHFKERPADAKRRTRQSVQDLLASLDDHQITCEVQIVSGEPATCILDASKEAQAGLIIIGTSGKSGLTRLFLGSTAESVLRRSTVPVLIIPAHSK